MELLTCTAAFILRIYSFIIVNEYFDFAIEFYEEIVYNKCVR